jgi:probable HAF family extracellular repeat protein
MWTRETGMVDLGTLGGYASWAHAVSDDGLVVGNSQTASGQNHAFAWSRRSGMIDIGTAGLDSWAEHLNVNRETIGQAYTPAGTRHGFVWTRRDGAIDLGTLGGDSSYATAVNDRGLVVGGSWTPGNLIWRAFAWSPASGMEALDAPGGGRSQANAINDNFIVGSSCDAGGVACHATLWKPPSRSSRD